MCLPWWSIVTFPFVLSDAGVILGTWLYFFSVLLRYFSVLLHLSADYFTAENAAFVAIYPLSLANIIMSLSSLMSLLLCQDEDFRTYSFPSKCQCLGHQALLWYPSLKFILAVSRTVCFLTPTWSYFSTSILLKTRLLSCSYGFALLLSLMSRTHRLTLVFLPCYINLVKPIANACSFFKNFVDFLFSSFEKETCIAWPGLDLLDALAFISWVLESLGGPPCLALPGVIWNTWSLMAYGIFICRSTTCKRIFSISFTLFWSVATLSVQHPADCLNS